MMSPADLRRGLCCSRSLPQTCTQNWAAPKFEYPNSEISEYPICTTITPGAFRSTWECSSRVKEHCVMLQGGLGASGSTSKHWWGLLESLRGLLVASRPICILLTLNNPSQWARWVIDSMLRQKGQLVVEGWMWEAQEDVPYCALGCRVFSYAAWQSDQWWSYWWARYILQPRSYNYHCNWT